MKTTLTAALLCIATLVLPAAHAQQSDPFKKLFLEHKAKAEQGDARAQAIVGAFYKSGQGVVKDYAEAVKWYRKAAEQNNAGAQIALGHCFENGEGVEKDSAEAVKWYRKANVAGAHGRLGNCYYKGEGVEKDYTEAVKWFRKAAEQHDGTSQNALGVCYANGHGVEKDYVEAYAWYDLASRRLELAAMKRDGLELATKNRDSLEPKLSPQQLAEAFKRTKEMEEQIVARLKSGGK